MLTAAQHQKVAILQQVANMVSQMQSVQGNVGVTTNVANNLLPLISMFERSDPDFQELASLLRQARVDQAPHVISNIASVAQSMLARLRGGLPYRTNAEGERIIWDPIRGNVDSPMFEKDEPIRPNSVYDWRGSKKYPMGKAFPSWNMIEGFGGLNLKNYTRSIGYGAYGDNNPFAPNFTICKSEGGTADCPSEYVKEFGSAALATAATNEMKAPPTAASEIIGDVKNKMFGLSFTTILMGMGLYWFFARM